MQHKQGLERNVSGKHLSSHRPDSPMNEWSRDREVAVIFRQPWTYPGLPVRPSTSCRLTLAESHHLVWSSWTIFDDGQQVYARRIEWPCMAGQRSQTGEFTQTFAAECVLDRHVAEALIAQAITAARSPAPAQADSIAIDGAQRHVRLWQTAEQPSLDWGKLPRGSLLDVWFEGAVDFLDKQLPDSRAHAYDETTPADLPSKTASDPRRP